MTVTWAANRGQRSLYGGVVKLDGDMPQSIHDNTRDELIMKLSLTPF